MNRTLPGLLLLAGALLARSAPDRPNILWLTSEDNGPQLGCYGDTFATTPNLDQLAAKGMLYLHAWSTAPVCAPARTAIITGVYPPSLGAEHMRSLVPLPGFMRLFPQLLRDSGYYCSNNSKEDYNLVKPGKVWDDSSAKAHWKNRQLGQPFFAIFNHTVTHESQIRKRPHTPVHIPSRVPLPAYHPDTPETRRDWAQYYDKITEMDALVGQNLKELAEAGLAEDTIIFYYGDHGSGMPRSKRSTYNSGLHVPLIVFFPPKYQHLAPKEYAAGARSSRLVDFTDLAPTLLSLVGIKPPAWMQGQPFLGPHETKPRRFLYGFRGRMDERYDLVRAVRDERYVYIRNYLPHLPHGQHVDYMFQTTSTQVWKEKFERGELTPPQTHFWEPKTAEELYDLHEDPDEVHNLALSKLHRDILRRLRRAHEKWELRIRDVGFLPEEEIHSRSETTTPYEMGHDRHAYPLSQIMAMASLAANTQTEALPKLRQGLQNHSSAIRYWAALGILMRGEPAFLPNRTALRQALEDVSLSVRVVAAESLARFGDATERDAAFPVLLQCADLEENNLYVSLLALNALDRLDEKALPWRSRIEALPTQKAQLPPRLGGYTDRLLAKTLADLNRLSSPP